MPRAGSKKTTRESATSATRVTKSAVTDAPPAPFAPIPAGLAAFTNTLPTDHVFLLHADTSTSALRRKVFIVPVLLNTFLAGLLIWRLYYAVPEYLYQVLTIFGYQTSWTVDTQAMPAVDIFKVITSRTAYLMIDYLIFFVLGRWPYEFLFGSKYGRFTGAAGWKLSVGFNREKEAVVRRGRGWDDSIFASEVIRREQGKTGAQWTKEEELIVYTRCTAALRKTYTSRTSYLLLDKDWDLDFQGMIDANELIDEGKLNWADMDHVVLVPFSDHWFCWYPHAVESRGEAVPIPELPTRDERLETLRQKLIAMDCEDLFYRWIEIVQYETSREGGFDSLRKKAAVEELQSMLKERGLDEHDFWQSIGGEGMLPGLD